MLAELIAFGVLRANLCGAAAVLAVFALRGPVRRWFGAEAAYRLWTAPPAAAAASLFPGLHLFSTAALEWASPAWPALEPLAALLFATWLLGAAITAARLVRADRRFRRAAAAGEAGPAVRGVLWPRLVTPAGFTQRFTAAERALILAHERAHIRRRDPAANLALAAVQCLAWFNPLTGLAARALRLDQEMACDAAVLAARPAERAAYGRALLKAQLAAQETGYAWAAFGGGHPLETRLRRLGDAPPARRWAQAGLGLAALAVLAAWSLAPAAFDAGAPLHRPWAGALLIDLTPGGAGR